MPRLPGRNVQHFETLYTLSCRAQKVGGTGSTRRVEPARARFQNLQITN
jgi:hypothetical protein